MYFKLLSLIALLFFVSTHTYAQKRKPKKKIVDNHWAINASVSPIYTNRDLYGFYIGANAKYATLFNVGVEKQFNKFSTFISCAYFNVKKKGSLRYYTNPSAIRTNGLPPTEPFLGYAYSNPTLSGIDNFHFLQLQLGASYAVIKRNKWDLSIKLAYNPTIIVAQNYVINSLQDGKISQRSANNKPNTKNNSLAQLQTGVNFNYQLYKNISAFAEADFATVRYEKNDFQYQIGAALGISYQF